ncbi:DUF2927 domain-containing protein [Rhodobacter ferrooxidans]|uniref:ATP-dependent transcriptional regulator n=1 Tax=Rhodobacter ferrooxidans TaxID=371731 RepID=C8RXZ5_9RHOB|nr:DUF2927 domain-containing protein [Rhodobacter sp. SW2]EEW26393.1 conserved hypothetical protein [Rhodobacter sp. SW2]
MRRLCLASVLALSGCVAAAPPLVTMTRATDVLALDGLPAMKTFGPQRAPAPTRSNAEIAQDFLALEFRMESGRALPVLSRFDGPITVALTGAVPATAARDLAAVVARFRAEAGIDIRQTDSAARITVEFIPRAQIQGVYANVACFVVPRVSSWADYRAARGAARLDWATVTAREQAAIFVPADTSPQEVRDCLHEELAQAMGPLNDLYSLSDSVFNDDNFHTTLTGFDMLVLRAHYAPELRSGMTEAEVAALLPDLLARLNPGGRHAGNPVSSATPRAWIDAMEKALGGQAPVAARRAAARRTLEIATAQGWHDSRLAFSQFAVGRLNIGHDPATALVAFTAAAALYRSLPGGQIHAAHVDMQLAAFALRQGDAKGALVLADRAIPVVTSAQNAALLATLLMVKAEALEALGRTAQAQAVRLDSLGWARYGFGSAQAVQTRMAEIAALTPPREKG